MGMKNKSLSNTISLGVMFAIVLFLGIILFVFSRQTPQVSSNTALNASYQESRELFESVPDNYTIYSFKVSDNMQYASLIKPDYFVDLYINAMVNETEVNERFITNVYVLAIRDKSGITTKDASKISEPSVIFLQVPDKYYEILVYANYKSNLSFDLKANPSGGASEVVNQELYNYIMQDN